ncbi:MAG: thermonuclease family protein [Cucumibacter sp.]
MNDVREFRRRNAGTVQNPGPRVHRGQGSARRWLDLLVLPGFAFVAVAFFGAMYLRSAPIQLNAATGALYTDSFSICSSAVRVTCVVDGDTIWHRGVKIRLADINTPEVSAPQCAHEAALGRQATLRLNALLNAGPFEIGSSGSRDEDVYGRKLRVVTRDGQSLGEVLVAEGLAETWTGSPSSWC